MDAARPILVVHATAGDESLYTGGTLALLTDAGSALTVLTCAGEVSDAAATRDAMSALRVLDHRVLGAPNARIAGAAPRGYSVDPSRSDALVEADPAEVAADIATVIATIGAGVVIGPSEDDGYRRAERYAASRAARRAAEVMGVPYYPVTTDPWLDAEEIDVASVIDRKAAAVRAFPDRTLDGDTVVLRDGSRMPLARVERFDTGKRRERSVAEWSELGIGGRITALIVAGILGAVVGALGTVAFQSTLIIAGLSLPAGLVASLFVVATVLAGLRLVLRTRFAAAAAAIGTLGVIAVLSQESPGGSVLVPAVALSYYWLYGPMIIAFMVLAWPDPAHRRRPDVEEPRVRIAEASNRKEHPHL